MKVLPVPPYSKLIDTVSMLTEKDCKLLRDQEHVTGVIRYLGSITPNEVATILGEGLGLQFVTFAGQYSGDKALAHLKELKAPSGVTVWLDVESTGSMQAPTVIGLSNAWGTSLDIGGFEPGIYVGVDAKMNSAELMRLTTRHYWHSCSRVWDRNSVEAAPSCGYGMIQLVPGNHLLNWGLLVDFDISQNDYQGRSSSWIVAS